jgi:hypothetical protein
MKRMNNGPFAGNVGIWPSAALLQFTMEHTRRCMTSGYMNIWLQFSIKYCLGIILYQYNNLGIRFSDWLRLVGNTRKIIAHQILHL